MVRKKKSSSDPDYKKYFYVSMGTSIAVLIVVVVLFGISIQNNKAIVGEAFSRSGVNTGLADTTIQRTAAAEDNLLDVLRNCLCDETCGEEEEEPEITTCFDKDGGNLPEIAGTTYLYDEDRNELDSRQDSCDNRRTEFTEYYCEGGAIKSETTPCHKGVFKSCNPEGTSCLDEK